MSLPAGAADIAANQMGTPMADATMQPTVTPQPEDIPLQPWMTAGGSTAAGSMDVSSCPMMSGAMTGNGTSMQGMPGTSGMSGMPGMSGTSGMQGMSISPGMRGASGLVGAQGIGVVQPASEQGFSIFDSDPWRLLGWLALFLAVLGLIVGLAMGVFWLIGWFKRGQPVQTGT